MYVVQYVTFSPLAHTWPRNCRDYMQRQEYDDNDAQVLLFASSRCASQWHCMVQRRGPPSPLVHRDCWQYGNFVKDSALV